MGPSKAKAATKAEKKRLERIVELGCVACLKSQRRGRQPGATEVHHLLDGGVRRGHGFTIGLCGWHHRGSPIMPRSLGADINISPLGLIAENAATFGPSLYHDARAFHARYGTDSELLEFQNKLLAEEA